MTIKEYQSLAMRTVNPDLSKKDMLINSVMGLCGESGEAIDMDLEEIMTANIEKLKKRYPDGFSTADSIMRVDTKES